MQGLRERIQPYFLRRMKSEVFNEDNDQAATKLSKKNDIIVWLRLTSCQVWSIIYQFPSWSHHSQNNNIGLPFNWCSDNFMKLSWRVIWHFLHSMAQYWLPLRYFIFIISREHIFHWWMKNHATSRGKMAKYIVQRENQFESQNETKQSIKPSTLWYNLSSLSSSSNCMQCANHLLLPLWRLTVLFASCELS